MEEDVTQVWTEIEVEGLVAYEGAQIRWRTADDRGVFIVEGQLVGEPQPGARLYAIQIRGDDGVTTWFLAPGVTVEVLTSQLEHDVLNRIAAAEQVAGR